MRFSDSKLSSSNLPTLTFNQGLFRRLSKRTNTASIWNAPVLSEEGRTMYEMFFAKVPSASMSRPLQSKPCCVTCPSVVEPGVEPSTATRLVLTRCHSGVMRNEIGQYDGFW